MNPDTGHPELKELMLETQRLVTENNELLKKLHRNSVRSFWFSIIWIVLFVVLPLIAVFKLAMPLYNSLGGSPGTLDSQLNNLQELQTLLEQQR
jgi:hypothetical protein